MTKKHFEAIAAIIASEVIENPAAGFDDGYDAGVTAVAEDLADYFGAVNDLFNRDRFLKACGVS